MTALANTDITVTLLDRKNYGKQRQNLLKLTFGNSTLTYPSGGLALPSAANLGLKTPLNFLQIVDDVSPTGTEWKYDYANGKLRAYRNQHIPAIILDEAVTLTSDAGTLKYLPAYIICAVGTISATVQPLRPCPTGVTLATKEFTVSFTTGAVTTKASDAVTSMKVSYIPQQPTGFFSQANMAIEESITLATGGVNTASRAATMQYCYQTTATAARLPFNNQTAASGRPKLDINNSSATTFTAHADNDAKVAKVTYLKYAGLANNPEVVFIDQAAISLSSQAKEWGKTAGDLVGGWIIPGFGGQIVGKETTNYLQIYLGNADVTAAVSIAKYEIAKNKITTAESAAQTSIEDTPLLFMSPFTTGQTGPVELTTNDAPAATTLYVVAYAD